MASVGKNSRILFEAKTNEAYAIKVLVDALNYYLDKKGSFVVNKKGIFLQNMNKSESVACDLHLLAENFQEYECHKNEIAFCINLHTMYTNMLKKIKKKDTIHLEIIEEGSSVFLKITKESPEDKGNYSSSRTSLTEIRQSVVDIPTGYDSPVTVLSKTFQKSCREVTNPQAKDIQITCWNGKRLRFFINKDNSIENEAYFGSTVKDDEKHTQRVTFQSKFSSSSVLRPVKLAGLSANVKIFVKEGLPLCYKLSIGSLGEMNIYIKSNDQIQAEKDSNNDVNDDEIEDDS
jgi:DNA polymerase III sliding clamp (beta) subunit (PCNA family)